MDEKLPELEPRVFHSFVIKIVSRKKLLKVLAPPQPTSGEIFLFQNLVVCIRYRNIFFAILKPYFWSTHMANNLILVISFGFKLNSNLKSWSPTPAPTLTQVCPTLGTVLYLWGEGGGGACCFVTVTLKKLWPNPEKSFYFMAHPLLFVKKSLAHPSPSNKYNHIIWYIFCYLYYYTKCEKKTSISYIISCLTEHIKCRAPNLRRKKFLGGSTCTSSRDFDSKGGKGIWSFLSQNW